MTAFALESGFSAAIAFRDLRLGFFAGRPRPAGAEAGARGEARARQLERAPEIIREPRRVVQIDPDGRARDIQALHAAAMPRAYAPSAARSGAAVARYEAEPGRVLSLVA